MPLSCSPTALHVLSLMVFWGQIQNYMMRVNLSILIVAMAKDTRKDIITADNGTLWSSSIVEEVSCQQQQDSFNSSSGVVDANEGEFEWDEMTRGLILGSFSWGYLITQLPGGRMSEMFGVKRVYGLCLLVCGLLTLLSPLAVRCHFGLFMVLRLVQGLCEGVTFPSLHAMTARWVPPNERSSFIARSYFGTTFGMILTFPMCGLLVQHWGWESAFYVIGCLTTLWFVLWWILVFDFPETHPRISEREKRRILEAIGDEVETKTRMPVPWREIITSRHFYAVLVTDIGNCWGLITLAVNGPSYIRLMLGVDIARTGFLSSAPMLCRYLGGLVHSFLADRLLISSSCRLVSVRRIFNSISQCAPAITMILLAFSGCDVTYAVGLMCVGCFFNGAITPGHFSSYIDLAPNFSGTLFGIGNTFSGGATGFLVPAFIGAITQGNMTFAAWRTVFATAAAIYFVGNLFYVAFISADVQWWNFRSKSGEGLGKEEVTESTRL